MEAKDEVKIRGRLGPDTADDKSIRIRIRVVGWTAEGIEYEADQRHTYIYYAEIVGVCRNRKGFRHPALDGRMRKWSKWK